MGQSFLSGDTTKGLTKMTVELTPVTTGMKGGPEAIQQNFDAINAALPVIGEWIDATPYLNKNFSSYNAKPLEFKITASGDAVMIRGTLTVVTATTGKTTTMYPMFTKLPFKLAPIQYQICMASGGATWGAMTAGSGDDGDTGDAFTIFGGRYIDVGQTNSTGFPNGKWLALGGLTFALA